jgi:hypothetical protein
VQHLDRFKAIRQKKKKSQRDNIIKPVDLKSEDQLKDGDEFTLTSSAQYLGLNPNKVRDYFRHHPEKAKQAGISKIGNRMIVTFSKLRDMVNRGVINHLRDLNTLDIPADISEEDFFQLKGIAFVKDLVQPNITYLVWDYTKAYNALRKIPANHPVFHTVKPVVVNVQEFFAYYLAEETPDLNFDEARKELGLVS